MNKSRSFKSNHSILRVCCLLGMAVFAQNLAAQPSHNSQSDSISLNDVISQTLNNYPTLRQANEIIKMSDAKINMAKAGYYPYADINASYTRIGPVVKFDFPNYGEIQLYPNDNYNAAVEFNQNIYDFGRTSKNIAYETQNKEIAKQNVEQVKQRLSMMATNCFFSIAYLQDAIITRDSQLKTLNRHLDFIIKKKETGSATQYELLTTQVRISDIGNKKLDLEIALKTQLSVLNSLLGQPENTPHHVKKEFDINHSEMPEDSLIGYALNHRDEMMMAKQKLKLSQLQYNVIKTQDNPTLNLFGSAGGKNGYIPDLNAFKPDFVAGIGFKMPLFDGNRTKNNLVLVQSNIESNNLDLDLLQRNITNEVIESESNYLGAIKKIDQYKLQLNQALQAYSLAETSYKAGAITNLDLLDAATSVSESKLQLLKSWIDCSVSLFRLKAALGERLY